jgi:putative hydrolase of the HAD superfamily
MTKAVLFDAGGTLFRVRGSVGDAYATVAARHGVTVTADEIELHFRAAFRQMPPLAFPNALPDELPQREFTWWKQLVATVFTGARFADFDAFFGELFDYFADATAWDLFPDTRPALDALKARDLRLGLVSNFDGRLIRICEGLGIAGSFDAIVMSGRAGFAKPDPRIFGIALSALGVGATEAIHVGDNEREDLEGARAAGLRGILICRDGITRSDRNRVPDLLALRERI